MYDRVEKYSYVANAFYSIFKPIIKGTNNYRTTLQAVYKNPDYSPIKIDFEAGRRIGTIIIDLPGRRPRKPVVYHIYISAQFSRKLSPAQLMPKIRKLLRERRKYNYEYTDRATYLYTPKGLTSGARELIRRYGVIPVKSRDDIVRNIAKYFKNRYVKLLAALKGKRLYGELLLLALILREITKQYLQYTEDKLGINDPLEPYLKYYNYNYTIIQLLETGVYIEKLYTV